MAAPRQTRAEKKAETRERLLAAGERIAVRDGFERISLDRVAEAAGLTKGAVYSNFSSKEEFLLEVAMRSTGRLHVGYEIFAADDLRGLLELTADSLAQATTRRKDVIVAFEFVTTALRDPKLRRAYLAGEPDPEEEDAADRWLAAHRDELPIPEEPFFEVVNALAWGFLLRRLLHGDDAVPEDLMTWAFTRLLPREGDSSG